MYADGDMSITYEALTCNEFTMYLATLTYGHFNWLMPPKDGKDLLMKCERPAVVREFDKAFRG